MKELEQAIAILKNVSEKLNDLREKDERSRQPYSVGQRFTIDEGGEKYILAQIAPNVCCLVNLESGNRYSEPVKVEDSQNISEVEMFRIAGDDDFKEL